jgi:DNA/RNA-binding protein KIN17
VIKLDLKLKETKKVKEDDKSTLKNVFKDLGKGEFKKKKGEEEEGGGGKKRRMTALEEIMEMEKRRKRAEKEKEEKEKEEASAATSLPWLRKNIVVKIVTKSLGDKYFKKKGYVKVGRIRLPIFQSTNGLYFLGI